MMKRQIVESEVRKVVMGDEGIGIWIRETLGVLMCMFDAAGLPDPYTHSIADQVLSKIET